MQSYVPEESYLTQYPEWGRLPKTYFKSLPATRDLRQSGALLFIEGKVTELKPLKSRAGFEACVNDGKRYGTSAWVEPGAEVPAFECGCARANKRAMCTHVLAVLSALEYLFHERNSLPLAPLSNNVERLAAHIDQSKRKSKKKLLRRIRMRDLQATTPYLEGDAALSEGFIQVINPYGEMRRLARNTVELPTFNIGKALRTLVDFVRDTQGIKLEAESADGDFIPLKPEMASIGARLRFEADSQKNIVNIQKVAESIDPSTVLAQLDDQHYIFLDGRVAYLDEQRTQSLEHSYIDMEEGFTDFSRKSHEWPIDYFNECSIRIGHQERRIYRQCDFGLSSNPSSAEDNSPKKKPAKKVNLTLNLRRNNDPQRPGYLADFEALIDNQSIIIGGILSDFIAKLMAHAQGSTRFLGRQARCNQIFEAAAHLPSISKQKERDDYIQEMTQRAVFEKPEHQRAVRKFLQQIEKDYCRPKSNSISLCLYEDPSDEESPVRWHAVQLPLPELLALTATLYRHCFFEQIFDAYFSVIEVKGSGELLSRLTEICERSNITLRIDESITRIRPTVVELLIQSTDTTDWFELKPYVRCEGLDIGQEDWDLLLRGKLVLDDGDGGLLLPRIEQRDAFEAMVETFGANSGGNNKPVHRLHLLDWIGLRAQGLAVTLPPEIEALYESLKNFERIPEQALPRGLHAELRPYQKLGYEWLVFLYEHRLGACLADDMGLGKTLQALAFIAYLLEKSSKEAPFRALAVLPTSLLFNWQQEAAKFLPDLSVDCYSGSGRDPAMFDSNTLTLTSYDLLWRDGDAFKERDFDLVIFDEAQALKNHRSRRCAAARQLNRSFTLCLTGTPMENHPGEFHSIMDLTLPGLMGPRKAFDQSLRNGDERPLHRAHPFLLRRTKDAIHDELPPKVEADVHLEMNVEQRSIYTRVVAELRKEVEDAYREHSAAQAGMHVLAALTKLRQLCISPSLLGHKMQAPSPKIQHLIEQVLELNEEGHSVLVFSQFVKALDLLEKGIKQAGPRPLRLDGKTPAKARGRAVEKFQTSKTPTIFLISLKAGGTGLNLTRASHVIHLDPWWNPAVENQASDRAHRIGQQQTVFIHRLLMRDSIEEKMMALKAKKQKLFQAVVEDPTAARQKGPVITKEDFDLLLGA